MTIPDEIIEALHLSEEGRALLKDISDSMAEKLGVRSLSSRRMMAEAVEAFIQALTAHGYKITGPEVTETMGDAHFEAHAAAPTFFAAPAEVWRAMHTAAPTTPWEKG